MIEILILVGVLFFGAHIGWRAREQAAIRSMQEHQFEKLQEHIEGKKIPITLEYVEGQLFCYRVEDGMFMANGKDWEELTERLTVRFPGKKFICDEQNLKSTGFYS